MYNIPTARTVVLHHAGTRCPMLTKVTFTTPAGDVAVWDADRAPVAEGLTPLERLVRADQLDEQGHALLATAERMVAFNQYIRDKRRYARLARALGHTGDVHVTPEDRDAPPTVRDGTLYVGWNVLVSTCVDLLMR